jgi:hypothetical protein
MKKDNKIKKIVSDSDIEKLLDGKSIEGSQNIMSDSELAEKTKHLKKNTKTTKFARTLKKIPR